ncbi:hypothetical protein CDL12_16126 [Handroanthus impetiginosus]|uniref:Uncharacterized protein n=1 Tax=Handroanthus impetiginosus TaxID=429701 RepID=A0A2G9H168_9LAMI|nr:hypothetical protein CDL12_16126 [Handroanthus impetiginosus]
MKAQIIYNFFFIGFLLTHGLNSSAQNPLPRYDQVLRVAHPPPSPPRFSKPHHVRIRSSPPPPPHRRPVSWPFPRRTP